MSVHVCKQCGRRFEYCRACVFRPIFYKDAGYCSKACHEASKNKIEEVVLAEDVEVVVIEEDTSTPTEEAIEYPYFFTATKEDIEDKIEIEEPEMSMESELTEDEIVEEEFEKEENEINENKQNYGEAVLGE